MYNENQREDDQAPTPRTHPDNEKGHQRKSEINERDGKGKPTQTSVDKDEEKQRPTPHKGDHPV